MPKILNYTTAKLAAGTKLTPKLQFACNCSIICLVLFFSSCQSALIKKKDLLQYNKILQQQSYVLKDDIAVGEGLVYKKGMLVKIWVESTPSLLKIKCYPANHDRENAYGKLVTYFENDNFKKKEFTYDDLKEAIHTKLDLYAEK